MELSWMLMKSLLVMAAMAGIGYLSVKLGFLTFADSRALSAVNLYVLSSCVTLSAFQTEFDLSKLLGLGINFAAALVIQLIYIFVTKPMGNALKLDGVDRASMIYSNAGNLLVPLIVELLGPEYVLYTCSFRTVQLFLIWSHCPPMLCPGTKGDLKKLFKNPNILAILIGMVLFFTGLRIPGVLGTAVDNLAGCIGPMCMFTLGVIMADTQWGKVLTTPRYYLVSLGRLVGYPAIFVALTALTGITRRIPAAREWLLITLLACAAPVASNVAQMARLFGADAEKAGAINVLTVLLAVITMPLMTFLYLALC